jgi:Bacteriophage baseplate protein W
MATDSQGRGFAFPLRPDARGRIEESADERKVRESILTILGTEQGERLMRPDFGCRLKSLVFAPNSAATASLAGFYIEESLTKWEPRISLDSVSATNEVDDLGQPLLVLRLSYHLLSAGTPQSLSFELPLA